MEVEAVFDLPLPLDVIRHHILPFAFELDDEYMRATYVGNIERMKLLESCGSGMRCFAEAFVAAARRGYCHVLQHLVPKIDYRHMWCGTAAVRDAAEYGRIDAVRYLTGLKISAASQRNAPLRMAALNGHTEVVQHLLTRPNVRVGTMAFQNALKNNCHDICTLLVEADKGLAIDVTDYFQGNDCSITIPKARFIISIMKKYPSEQCNTMLKRAIELDEPNLVQQALALPNVDPTVDIWCKTAWASEAIMDIMFQWRDWHGRLPVLPNLILRSILLTSKRYDYETFEYLLNLRDDYGELRFAIGEDYEVLRFACRYGTLHQVQLLVGLRRANGQPVFNCAAYNACLLEAANYGKTSILCYLLTLPRINKTSIAHALNVAMGNDNNAIIDILMTASATDW